MPADLVYLDMMILSALCGKPAPSDHEREAMVAVKIGVDSGLLQLAAGYAHFRELKRYRNSTRRACIRKVLQGAHVFAGRTVETEHFWVEAIRAGAGVEDARQIACSRSLGAVLLTWDKELLDLRRDGRLGTILTPAEFMRGIREGKSRKKP